MAQSHLARNERITGWAFIMPALVLLGIFMIYPILWSLWMSFQVGRGMQFSFGGLANITRLTQDPAHGDCGCICWTACSRLIEDSG